MKKIKYVTTLLFSLLSINLFAETIPTCPSIKAIQMAGFSNIQKIERIEHPFSFRTKSKEYLYGAYQINPYDTHTDWLFSILYIAANSLNEAKNRAQLGLESLSGQPIAESSGSSPIHWYCQYHVKYGYFARAET
jgi:hypothetical protein